MRLKHETVNARLYEVIFPHRTMEIFKKMRKELEEKRFTTY